MTDCLAVVTARGGSKGVPGKNLAPVAGRPLIAWTIAAAQGATQVTRVIVSTDSQEISGVAREWGAEVPFLRPAELARDQTPGVEPVLHAIEWLAENEGYRPNLVLLLQPTSPLRTAADIEAALARLAETGADAVVGVTLAEHHPYWTKAIDDQGYLRNFVAADQVPDRRQDLPPAYAVNGAIYLIRREVLLRDRTLFPERTVGYAMPPERSLDVDTRWDLDLADIVLRGHSAHRTPTVLDVAGREIGPGRSCFVIAEAGVNHDGDPGGGPGADPSGQGGRRRRRQVPDLDHRASWSHPTRRWPRTRRPAPALRQASSSCSSGWSWASTSSAASATMPRRWASFSCRRRTRSAAPTSSTRWGCRCSRSARPR